VGDAKLLQGKIGGTNGLMMKLWTYELH